MRQRGTGEAVNDSDNDWSNGSIAFHAAENAIETRGRNGFVGVTVSFCGVSVRMSVNVVAMTMHMFVMVVGRAVSERPHGDAKIQRA